MTQDTKSRLDILLVTRGYFDSREAAKRAVMAGMVSCAGVRVDKPGTLVRSSVDIAVAKPAHSYVSRGGVKLAHALATFGVEVINRVVLDVGASTGGFTDCVLQRGARFVHAVDVGYGQFAWKLRNDGRVHLLERTNFRHVLPTVFQPQPDMAVMDVSFISIQLLFAKLRETLAPGGDIVTLVKPQFEAGRQRVGKGGIVRDAAVHLDVLQSVLQAARAERMVCKGVTFSPIEGGDGNIEFFLWLALGLNLEEGMSASTATEAAADAVRDAWQALRQLEVLPGS